MGNKLCKYEFEKKFLVPIRVIYAGNGSVLMNPILSIESYGLDETIIVAQQPGVHLPCPPNIVSPCLGISDLLENPLFYLDLVLLEKDIEERSPKVYVASGNIFEELLTFLSSQGVREVKKEEIHPNEGMEGNEFFIVGNIFEPFEKTEQRIKSLKDGTATQRKMMQETVQEFLNRRG